MELTLVSWTKNNLEGRESELWFQGDMVSHAVDQSSGQLRTLLVSH